MNSTTTMQPKAHAMAGSNDRRTLPVMSPSIVRRGPADRPGEPRSSAIQVESIADAQQPNGAEAHRGEQHDALEQRLPQRFDVEHEQQVADRAEHQRPEDGTAR